VESQSPRLMTQEQQTNNILQIFLVSCLFHHISVLKLTVHNAYTDYLTTGIQPTQTPSEDDWSIPKLERTDWLDLFDQEQRVGAFKCVWGVMEYVSRDVGVDRTAGEHTGESMQT
jgi:hypothetical protein